MSFRGAQRRGNLSQPPANSPKPARHPIGYCEIAPQGHFLALRAQGATAPLGPRNDKLEGLAPQNMCRKDCQPARRSLSAATDAIGAHHFNGGLYELQVPSRDCHVGLRPPRNDKSGAVTILTIHCANRPCSAGPGCPLPYKVQPGQQYRYCYIDSDYSIGQGGCQPGNNAGTS